ncbi:hypothetical protein Psi02_60890 [Planotetraspora silvatica]|uniref:Uncharacterized protein n=1 Tax=Planotetraspora silvatica TaxID=234614 RepID=A0A8J3V4A3_9ACTN|nr:hypothetical protein [Planotetraspora silvatica]GII49665.1 hypothetical protein Psi02_60890 [Planotetraspora silvatica]
MLLDLLVGALVQLIPPHRGLQRWMYRHPMLSSAGLGSIPFVGFSVAAWVDGEWPIPWMLTGGLGLFFAVSARLLIAMNVYVAKRQARHQSGHVPLDEKRRMSVNAEPYRAKHGPDRRRLSPEEPLPRLFESPGVPRRPEGDG